MSLSEQSFIHPLQEVMSRFGKYPIGMLFDTLSQGEFFMLVKIDCLEGEEGEVSITELTNFCHVSMPAVSRMLHSMEKKGYLERYASRKDKRTTFVKLTDLEKTYKEEAQKKVTKFIEKVSKQMGEEKMRQFTKLFWEFVDMMELEMKNIR